MMADKPLSYLGLVAFLCLVAMAGCGIFDPKSDDGGGPPPPPLPTYHVRFLPNLALENMRLAYQAKDSVYADSVYSPDYHGESSNAFDPGNVLFFTKAQEVSHVGALALQNDPIVSNIRFSMGDFNSWPREGSLDAAHPEWASITISQNIVLEITIGATTYTVGDNDFFEYQFAPTTPAAGSLTDTLWQIVRWREIKGAGQSK